MFDADKTGTINFDEFCGLWSFLAAWRGLFDRFDEDRSGSISFDEYSKALVAFGYRLGQGFVRTLYGTYERGGGGKMSFDLFVQSCIGLKRMTDVFKKYDEDRDGYITLSFEEFLTGEVPLSLCWGFIYAYCGYRDLETEVKDEGVTALHIQETYRYYVGPGAQRSGYVDASR